MATPYTFDQPDIEYPAAARSPYEVFPDIIVVEPDLVVGPDGLVDDGG